MREKKCRPSSTLILTKPFAVLIAAVFGHKGSILKRWMQYTNFNCFEGIEPTMKKCSSLELKQGQWLYMPCFATKLPAQCQP